MMSHDIESQVVSPSIPARTQRISADSLMDPIDDFFGHALRQQITRITHTGRPISANSDILPPYYHPSPRCSEYLPEYTPKAEPVALAMYLFKFGFRRFHPSLFLFLFLRRRAEYHCSVSAVLGPRQLHTSFAPPCSQGFVLPSMDARKDRESVRWSLGIYGRRSSNGLDDAGTPWLVLSSLRSLSVSRWD